MALVQEYLKKSDIAASLTVKESYRKQAVLWLTSYLFQHRIFQSAEHSVKDREWKALLNLVTYLSDKLKMRATPIPSFREKYSATGTFTYYQAFSLAQARPFYQVSAELFDLPVFWPLISHELAHCKLSETDTLQSLYNIAAQEFRIAKAGIPHDARIGQVMCDILATRLMGPAYAFPFLVKLSPVFTEEVPRTDPSFPFRIECMVNVLESEGLDELAEKMRKISEEKFTVKWDAEEISVIKSELLNAGRDFPLLASRSTYSESLAFLPYLHRRPPKEPVQLYLAVWTRLLEDPKNFGRESSQLSATISEQLEGLPSSFYSEA